MKSMNSRYQTRLSKSLKSRCLPLCSKKSMVFFMMARDPSSDCRLSVISGNWQANCIAIPPPGECRRASRVRGRPRRADLAGQRRAPRASNRQHRVPRRRGPEDRARLRCGVAPAARSPPASPDVARHPMDQEQHRAAARLDAGHRPAVEQYAPGRHRVHAASPVPRRFAPASAGESLPRRVKPGHKSSRYFWCAQPTACHRWGRVSRAVGPAHPRPLAAAAGYASPHRHDPARTAVARESDAGGMQSPNIRVTRALISTATPPRCWPELRHTDPPYLP